MAVPKQKVFTNLAVIAVLHHLPGGVTPTASTGQLPCGEDSALKGRGVGRREQVRSASYRARLTPGALRSPHSRRGLPGELPVRSRTGSRDKSPVRHRQGSGLPWASSG